ncbi:putative methyltransferase-domain-containing protein [Pavlovales sp. CCMP2436]|nr:putative methyltransferase-domain-containing protein [Pavlovales sp. CCMP2436]|mmetsp:Transcript_37180/g.92515  ORF Transcript_37180/g.92515 Transcript_37180/m.92515 type:complete len:291 (-) Transcript_37180:294-1166(-)
MCCAALGLAMIGFIGSGVGSVRCALPRAALARRGLRVAMSAVEGVRPHEPRQQVATEPGGGEGEREDRRQQSAAPKFKRPRQHVNPLASHHQRPLELPDDWDALTFSEPRPLHIDIGCASGHFPLQLAEQRPGTNVLGLEIRESLVERANGWVSARSLSNLRYLACNANVDLPMILRASRSPLASVTIQFPDPWFKARHHKRRVVQAELVEHIAASLPVGGTFFVQSDVQELAESMREQIEITAGALLLATPGPAGDGWIDHNPIGIATEREIATARKGGSVYRALYTRS